MSHSTYATLPSRGGLNLRRALWAILRWSTVPIVMTLIGVFLGAFVSGFARPSAATVVSVDAAQNLDATAMARVSESMVQQMGSESVFVRAVETLQGDGSADDLMDRTRIAAVSSTSIIRVEVTSDSLEQAIAEANAVVGAFQTLESEARTAELARVTESVRALMGAAESGLADPQAEQSRLSQLGSAMASSQAAVATTSPSVSLVQGARAVRASVGPLILSVAGGLAGALLGLGAAVYLGRHHGRVNSIATLSRLFPSVPAASAALVPDILASEGDHVDTILITGPARGQNKFANEVRGWIESSSKGRRYVQVVVSPFADAVVRRVASDPSAIALVTVDSSELRMNEVAPILERLAERAYVVDLGEQA